MATATPANTPHTGAQASSPEHVVLDMTTMHMQELRLPAIAQGQESGNAVQDTHETLARTLTATASRGPHAVTKKPAGAAALPLVRRSAFRHTSVPDT